MSLVSQLSAMHTPMGIAIAIRMITHVRILTQNNLNTSMHTVMAVSTNRIITPRHSFHTKPLIPLTHLSHRRQSLHYRLLINLLTSIRTPTLPLLTITTTTTQTKICKAFSYTSLPTPWALSPSSSPPF